MANVPHFNLPFVLRASADVVEQDTIDDIANCVVAALSTPIGWREEAPEIGTEDQAFKLLPLDLAALRARIVELEPRAEFVATEYSDRFDQLVARIVAEVADREGQQ